MPRLVVDQYGHALQSVTGGTGGATRTLHDAFLAALAHSLREAGIKFKGGERSNGSCKHIFLHLKHAFVGADEKTLRKLSVVITDLLVDFTNVEASAPGGGDAGDSLFSFVREPADTKTLVCGKNYSSFRAENPYKRKNYPAEQRAALVPRQYFSKACSLDHQAHGAAWGTVGPIEAKLLEYGALDGPDAHAVVGLVLGAFCELSTSCYSLFMSIARVAAARLLSFWKISPEKALAFSKQKIFRFGGLTGQRGWARLILGRLHDLVLPPKDPKDRTLDPGTVAHEHQSFFFPDNGYGSANAAGFDWRNGG
jgi:hypothetical protein